MMHVTDRHPYVPQSLKLVIKVPDTILSQNEIEYLRSQRIARIATASAATSEDGSKFVQPDVAPVGFDYDGGYFYVSGISIIKSKKYKNIVKNKKVALVVDDWKSDDSWGPRGIRIYGDADVVTRQGGYMDQTGHSELTYIRIRPNKKWSWGIDEPVFSDGKFNVNRAQADVDESVP